MLNFYPEKVFEYFEKISSIPHGSYNCTAIADYLEAFAKEKNLSCHRDGANNVVIYKNAGSGFEDAEPVILQGHTDMVCASEGDFDFINNAISIDSDGEYVFAKGTTLGGDNGIAVAMMLAVLDSDEAYPPLECVFTSDEEVGMVGAIALDMSYLKGKRMINVDSEVEGVFTIGCAGGVSCEINLPVSYNTVSAPCYRFELKGLHGGHSGVEINNDYVNGIRLMADFLSEIYGENTVMISQINGGAADNAIPKNGSCTFICEGMGEDELRSVAEGLMSAVREANNEPDADFVLDSLGVCEAKAVVNTDEVLSLIKSLPDGVLAYETHMPGSVKTSCNTGVVSLSDDNFVLRMSLRSSVNADRDALADSVANTVDFIGAECEFSGSYPAWEPVADSSLCTKAKEVYVRMFEKEPVVEVIHAGLECSVFSDRIKDFDCVSIGPDMIGIHTPEEKLNIRSVGRVYDYLCELLKNI